MTTHSHPLAPIHLATSLRSFVHFLSMSIALSLAPMFHQLAMGQSVTDSLAREPGLLVRIKLNAESLRVLRTAAGLSDAQLQFLSHQWQAYEESIKLLAGKAVEGLPTEEIDQLIESRDPQQTARAMELIAEAERKTRTSSDAYRTSFFAKVREMLDESQFGTYDAAVSRAVCVAAADGPLRGAAAQDFLHHPDIRAEFASYLDDSIESNTITEEVAEELREASERALDDYDRDLGDLVVRATYEHFDAYQRTRIHRALREDESLVRQQRQMFRAWNRVYLHTMRAAEELRIALTDALAQNGHVVQTMVGEHWRLHVLHAYLPRVIGVEIIPPLFAWCHTELIHVPDDVLMAVDDEYAGFLIKREPLLKQVVAQCLGEFEDSGHRGREWSDELRKLQELRFQLSQSILRSWQALLAGNPGDLALLEGRFKKLSDGIDGQIPIDSPQRWTID